MRTISHLTATTAPKACTKKLENRGRSVRCAPWHQFLTGSNANRRLLFAGLSTADIAIPDMTEPSGNVAGDSKSLAGVDQLPPNGLDMQDLQEQEVLKFDQEINEGSKTELSAKDDLPGALEKANVPGIDEGIDGEGNASSVPLDSFKLTEEAENQLLREEEARRSQQSRKRKGRIRELEETRAELAEKGLILLLKEKELLEKEQTLVVLREELQLERKLRALLTKEKEKAEEEAALAMGLCSGANMLP